MDVKLMMMMMMMTTSIIIYLLYLKSLEIKKNKIASHPSPSLPRMKNFLSPTVTDSLAQTQPIIFNVSYIFVIFIPRNAGWNSNMDDIYISYICKENFNIVSNYTKFQYLNSRDSHIHYTRFILEKSAFLNSSALVRKRPENSTIYSEQNFA